MSRDLHEALYTTETGITISKTRTGVDVARTNEEIWLASASSNARGLGYRVGRQVVETLNELNSDKLMMILNGGYKKIWDIAATAAEIEPPLTGEQAMFFGLGVDDAAKENEQSAGRWNNWDPSN